MVVKNQAIGVADEYDEEYEVEDEDHLANGFQAGKPVWGVPKDYSQ